MAGRLEPLFKEKAHALDKRFRPEIVAARKQKAANATAERTPSSTAWGHTISIGAEIDRRASLGDGRACGRSIGATIVRRLHQMPRGSPIHNGSFCFHSRSSASRGGGVLMSPREQFSMTRDSSSTLSAWCLTKGPSPKYRLTFNMASRAPGWTGQSLVH